MAHGPYKLPVMPILSLPVPLHLEHVDHTVSLTLPLPPHILHESLTSLAECMGKGFT